MSRRKHSTRDVPGRPEWVQLDLPDGTWFTIDRIDLDAVKAVGVWGLRYRPLSRASRAPVAVSHNFGSGRTGNRHVNLAQFILEQAGEPRPEGHDPDHLNFDVRDNRRANVRWLPAAENRVRHQGAA